MRAQKYGYIVNISSIAGQIAIPFQGVYSASKFALEGLSESLRMEVRRFGIKVVLIQPGDHRTELMHNRQQVKGALKAGSPYHPYFDKARELSVAVRGLKAVALSNPVMPVANGFFG